MAGKFQFDLISPEKTLFSGQAEEVNIPGSEGFFSVMAGHMPLIARLVPGPVRIRAAGSVVKEFIIFGGFAEVTNTEATVLAESAVPLDRLDKSDIERRITHARALLKDAQSEESRTRLEEFINHMSVIKA